MAKEDALEWLRFAQDDLESAVFLMGMQKRKLEIICYHCQQCAEKSIKALFALHDLEIPRTHDFRALTAGLRLRYSFSEHDSLLAGLQPFAVAVRYPFEIDLIPGDEEGAIRAAEVMLGFCGENIRDI